MRRFFENYKRYHGYTVYSTKAELKSEISNSYLTWLWWILDPLFFMLIYTFIVQIVFKTKVENLPVFVMSGLLVWNFFNKNVITSVKIIKSNKSIISQLYIPKYMLVIQKIYVNFFKFLISIVLLVIMALLFKVKIGLTIFYSIPLLILLLLLSFSISTIIAHFGVFIDDLANVIQIILRLMFYLSGIFYSIQDRLSTELANIMFKINPMAYLIESFRKIFMYQQPLNIKYYIYWLIITTLLSVIAVKLINKHENSYAKVI